MCAVWTKTRGAVIFYHYWLIEKKVGDFSNEPEQHSQRWMGLQLHWEMLKFKSFLTFSLSLFCGWHGSLVIAASSGKINASAFKKLRRLMDFQMHALDREKCLDHARCLFSLKWTMAIDGERMNDLKKSLEKLFMYVYHVYHKRNSVLVINFSSKCSFGKNYFCLENTGRIVFIFNKRWIEE